MGENEKNKIIFSYIFYLVKYMLVGIIVTGFFFLAIEKDRTASTVVEMIIIGCLYGLILFGIVVFSSRKSYIRKMAKRVENEGMTPEIINELRVKLEKCNLKSLNGRVNHTWICIWLAAYCYDLGDFSNALAYLNRIDRVAALKDNSKAEYNVIFPIFTTYIKVYTLLGDVASCDSIMDDARPFIKKYAGKFEYIDVFINSILLHYEFMHGRYNNALEYLDKSEAMAQASTHEYELPGIYMWKAIVFKCMGNIQQANEFYNMARAKAEIEYESSHKNNHIKLVVNMLAKHYSLPVQ